MWSRCIKNKKKYDPLHICLHDKSLVVKRHRMQFPTGKFASDEVDHPYADMEAPLWLDPTGNIRGRGKVVIEFDPRETTCWERFMYAPYGKSNSILYVREIIANLIKEGVGILLFCFLVPGIVAGNAGADIASRAILVGLIYSLSLFSILNWGYNDRMPRHLTLGATIAELADGSISWWLAVLYIVTGFLFSTFSALLLAATNTSAIPVIGGPNFNTLGGTAAVQILFTGAIALTVMDQFTTWAGKPRQFKARRGPAQKDEKGNVYYPNDDSAESPNNMRAYREDIGARPMVYASIVWALVTFAFYKFGLFTFNSYVYYAGALGSRILGATDAFNNIGLNGFNTGANITGVGAMFILLDVVGWMLAWGINALLYVLHNNEPRPKGDDSSYGSMHGGGGKKKHVNRSISSRIGNATSAKRRATKAMDLASNEAVEQKPIQLNAAAWTGSK